jgi:uncharacterized protein
MSKPDPTGESLESILASIRRSLAEQSTDVLNDESAPQANAADGPGLIAAGDGDVPKLFGGAGTDPAQVEAALAGDLAGRKAQEPPPPPSLGDVVPVRHEVPARSEAQARNEAPTGSLEEPPPPAPASLTAASAQAPQQDPFWFLSRRGNVVETKDRPQPPAPTRPQPAPPSVPSRPPETQPPRAEVVRGPLPPFFGSSAEPPKTEVMPVPGAAAGAGAVTPSRIFDAPQPPPEAVPRVPAPPEAAPRVPTPPVPAPPEATPRVHAAPAAPAIPAAPAASAATAREAALNGSKLPPLFGPAPADSKSPAADSSAQIRGLEAMVAELLRPMLRRWLDENMPRLVSAALKAEAENIAKRDPKKP